MRWVVREGCVRGEGRYLDCDEGWADWPGRAYKYNGRGWAEGDADQFGGRVVKLVAKRKPVVGYGRDADAMPWPGGGTICVAAAKEMGGLRMSLEKAEAYQLELAKALASQAGKLGEAEAEVERLRDEVARAYSTADEVWLRAMARSDHARRWKALAKRLLGERDAFRRNVDALLAEYDNLRGPAPSDEEIAKAAYTAARRATGHKDMWHAATDATRLEFLAAGKAARALPMGPPDLPLRRREVSDESLVRYGLTNDVWQAMRTWRDALNDPRGASWAAADKLEQELAAYARAAIALATRPVTREEFASACEKAGVKP